MDMVSWYPKIADAGIAVKRLRGSKWRNNWWKAELDEKARAQLILDDKALYNSAKIRLRNSIGKGYGTGAKSAPFADGRQTPYSGNLLFYAQHGTATCCRRCLAKWYDIPNGFDLDDSTISLLSGILIRYVAKRRRDYNLSSANPIYVSI